MPSQTGTTLSPLLAAMQSLWFNNNMKSQKPSHFPTLDLHGHLGEEVEAKLDRFLLMASRKASEGGPPVVRIMTGKGKGVVQSLVIEYLRQAKYTWRFEKSANGKPNEGVLLVPVK